MEHLFPAAASVQIQTVRKKVPLRTDTCERFFRSLPPPLPPICQKRVTASGVDKIQNDEKNEIDPVRNLVCAQPTPNRLHPDGASYYRHQVPATYLPASTRTTFILNPSNAHAPALGVIFGWALSQCHPPLKSLSVFASIIPLVPRIMSFIIIITSFCATPEAPLVLRPSPLFANIRTRTAKFQLGKAIGPCQSAVQ